jgi:hypothetical protein
MQREPAEDYRRGLSKGTIKTDEMPPSRPIQRGSQAAAEHDSGDVVDGDAMDGNFVDGNVMDNNVVDKGAVSLDFDFICLHPALSLSRP